ncbi:hypothetical protein GCM10010112_65990 [Actinoplanes lobatus]|uniref:Uncharacterized protein n=1 Tax=Actinoplanes lobatus TaxID=113568 RepID=A0A7W7HJY4_9ACTN|nr:hypothetical protein [Actinoplanes lobatus]MBB4751925.1 hypothetical protein [Actinoplanes lobatus]GGN85517.1 hypothetical protein GCM10010112_65990 [Actinoplanes lobatus]GIE44348.1 hypothetical protein Alo02nite_72460 [Actinoplanes lobatus]
MTERISQLLNEAVAGVEPVAPDPVGAVLRRGRSARRRSALMAAAVACAGLAVSGAVVGPRLTGGPDAGVVAAVPAAPYADGRTVVAGAVRFPVPDGWRAATSDQPCTDTSRTILIRVHRDEQCRMSAVEIFSAPVTITGGRVINLDSPVIQGGVVAPPALITLPGGEPGWLERASGSSVVLTLPWSRVRLLFRLDSAAAGEFIASMRSAPAGAGTLAVPRTAAVADLVISDAAGLVRPEDIGRIRAPATIDRLLGLLREQEDAVADAQACAGSAQATVEIVIKAAEGETSPVPEPSPAPGPGDTTVVVIALGGDCQEAVSSHGGRVRLSDETVAELKTIYGIGVR